MDFGNILNVAQQKQGSNGKKEVRYYKTKFEPPKKEVRSKELSSNIKKYLARVEEEKKQKALEEKHKRDELLALRSQDKKATKRVSIMLKSTKSANKSVLEDAVNNVNTAVTITGTEQPDEDDYGYVSQEADAYYKKMMEKYNAQPDDPKFVLGKKKNTNTNLGSTKDRVKAALEKEKEDALLPHKRKRKHKDPAEGGSAEPEEERKPEVEFKKPRPKVQAPPPMDFNELLKLAQQKQFEPVKIEPKKKDDEGPLMTKKQKREFEKEQAYKERRAKGLPPPPTPPQENKKASDMRIPKLSSASKGPDVSKKPIVPTSGGGRVPEKTSSTSAKPTLKAEKSSSSSSASKQMGGSERKPTHTSTPPPSMNRKPTAAPSGDRNGKPVPTARAALPGGDLLRKELGRGKDEKAATTSVRPAHLNTMMMNGKSSKPPPSSSSSASSREFPPADVKRRGGSGDAQGGRPKQFPPPDVRRFPPGDMRRFPPQDVRRKAVANKRRILDDDDEEYDSEMDDFIDDGPAEGEDYSKYISEIFGYDKSKYRYADDEDDNMESSFAQQMREECISTKIGIMEDLEDMKQEKLDKMMKAKMKKRGGGRF